MTRLPVPAPDEMSAEQRAVHDRVASGPRGGVRGPLALWRHRPELADNAQALGRYCRYETCLPPRLAELAILTKARIWDAAYEWQAHLRSHARSRDVRGCVRSRTTPLVGWRSQQSTAERTRRWMSAEIIEKHNIGEHLFFWWSLFGGHTHHRELSNGPTQKIL